MRLGHRAIRDKRVTTHLGLVGRAFGACGMYLLEDDRAVEESIGDVVERWGGEFFVRTLASWRELVHEWDGPVVHLTMYGLPVDEEAPKIRATGKEVLVVVGSEKVPPEIYKMADFNVAVGSQPHSEISALAILLDRLHQGDELKKDFKGHVRIIPSKESKRVISE